MAALDGQRSASHCNWVLGVTVALLLGTLVAQNGQRFTVRCHTQQSGRGSSSRAGSALRLPLQGCAPYGDEVQRAVDSAQPPYLSQAQLLWIAAALQGRGAATGGGGTRFLVFGLGHDSRVWLQANCGGRTAFLEDSAEWIQNVTAQLPDIEAHLVSYRGRFSEADEFFANPWLMEVPASVGDTCWENILVDAPMSYKPQHPGRMESAYFAVHTARRCIAAGDMSDVLVFLHDVNRKLEAQIIARILTAPDIIRLGVVKGKHGDLAAFRVVRAP